MTRKFATVLLIRARALIKFNLDITGLAYNDLFSAISSACAKHLDGATRIESIFFWEETRL